MTSPITFVDYLILGSSYTGHILARLLWKAKRGVIVLLSGHARFPNCDHTVFTDTDVLRISCQGFPRGSYRVETAKKDIFQARYLILAPTLKEPAELDIFRKQDRPARDEYSHQLLVNGEFASVNMQNLYSLSPQDVPQPDAFQQAAFVHRILEYRNHHVHFPCRVLPIATDAMVRAVLQRMSRHYPSTENACGDLIFPDAEGVNACYYENLPLDTLPDEGFGRCAQFYTIRLCKADQDEPPINTRRIPLLIVQFCGPEMEELILGRAQLQWEEMVQALQTFFKRTLARCIPERREAVLL